MNRTDAIFLCRKKLNCSVGDILLANFINFIDFYGKLIDFKAYIIDLK